MRPCDRVKCELFPCSDVRHECYVVPDVDVRSDEISIVLIAEAAPPNPEDYYYAKGSPLFEQTTVQAFRDAGADVASVGGVLRLGVYLTTAVKCGKTGYGITSSTVKECSLLLEQELALFPNARAYLLMGDVAIKAVNYIAARAGEGRSFPRVPRTRFAGGHIASAASGYSPPTCRQGPASSSRRASAG